MSVFGNLFTSTKSFETIYCNQLEEKLKSEPKNSYKLIDVRTTDEHRMGHIPGSLHIDIMSPAFADKIAQLDKDKNYYVYCRSGNRSAAACREMSKMGFTKLHNLAGGMMGWSGELSR
ncbi:MAG: rhodanese-like domain-containing protein [Candidatus Cyclobacteriaceae bacterium M3_2C_046]